MSEKIAAVILTRGDTKMLFDCLESLAQHVPADVRLEVRVLEHETEQADTDRLKEYLAKWPGSQYIHVKDSPDKEESFSSLNNRAAVGIEADYVWLLNNDILLHPGCVTEMLSVFQTHSDVGIVGAKLLHGDGTIQHAGVYFDQMGIPRHLGYRRTDSPEFPASQRSEYTDAVTFACAMIRREVWEALNGLDEDYFFNYEDVDFCLRARQSGWRCYFPHRAISTHLGSKSLQYRQTERHGILPNALIFQDKWIKTGELEKLVGVLVSRAIGPFDTKRMNLAFIPAGMEAGIAWWRVLLPAGKLGKKHLAAIEILNHAMPEQKVNHILDCADVAVWQAFFNEPVKRIAGLKEGRGWAMVYEYDDHPIYLSPYAICYRGLGTREIEVQAKDGTKFWLWRDGEAGFDLERNRENRQRQMEIMTLSDAITTTTEPLASFFKTFNKNVYALPNCIDFDYYRSVDHLYERKPGPIRIGWWGGDNHWHDISMIGKALANYVNTHDVKLVLMGAFYKGPLKGIDLNKVEDYPWIHCEAWPWRLGTAGLDVALVPLANPALPEMRFNHFKSEIKWLEASAMKIPTVVQGGVRAYENCIDGDNAYTFANEEEFTAKLDEACRNRESAMAIARRAYDWTREYRDLDKECYRWLQVYEDVVKKRPVVEPEEKLEPAGSNAVAEGAAF